MIPKETWKPVYDGSYSVSNLGRVRRNARALGFFLEKYCLLRKRNPATLMKRLALLQKQSLMTMRMQMETVIKVGLQSMKHARRRRK